MKSPTKKILLIGSFDTKGEEYSYVEKLIKMRGHSVIKMNFGTMDHSEVDIDIEAHQVAQAAGESLQVLKKKNDRGLAMTSMSKGAASLVKAMHGRGEFDGIFGMGGTGGSSVISAAMRELPIGVPKVLVSTVASGDTTNIVGTRDITLIPSVVDVAGINRISKKIFNQAVGSICGMIEMPNLEDSNDEKPVIAVSMFGNTTKCVDRCRKQLIEKGFEVLVFHCTGIGGKTMEQLVEDGEIYAVLDITTTEWADELCEGVFSAGSNRLEAAGKKGIPHLIVPGCIDMVNFGPLDEVPAKYKDSKLSVWNPNVTLMRTTPEQNIKLGEIFAEKANKAKGPVTFLLPLKGVSILDSPGQEFWWPEADLAMFDTLKSNLNANISVIELDMNINDDSFADRAVNTLLEIMMKGEITN